MITCNRILSQARVAKGFALRDGTAPRATVFSRARVSRDARKRPEGHSMNSIVYIVGAVVIVIAILSFLGLR